jgi:hypothetical protein
MFCFVRQNLTSCIEMTQSFSPQAPVALTSESFPLILIGAHDFWTPRGNL